MRAVRGWSYQVLRGRALRALSVLSGRIPRRARASHSTRPTSELKRRHGWDFDRMLAELFQEEDRARDMATRLQIAQTSRAAASARAPEPHRFSSRADGAPHDLRRARDLPAARDPRPRRRGPGRVEAARCGPTSQPPDSKSAGPDDDVAPAIADTARLLLHHTNFEGDYIYPELNRDAWRELMRESTTR